LVDVEVGKDLNRYIRPGSRPPIWCPGCGIRSVESALLQAIAMSGLDQDRIVIVTGIGCSGFMYNYLNFDAAHVTHGRALPVATGIKRANPELTVIVPMGDGDCAAIGGNHLIHTARRNIDVTALVLNNQNYGMTGGQYSPTTPPGSRTSTSPRGHQERAFDLCDLARVSGASYVARGATSYHEELSRLILDGILHPGFSFIEVLSPCPPQFGRRNRMPGVAEMTRWQRAHTVRVEEAAALGPSADKFVIGELYRETVRGPGQESPAGLRVQPSSTPAPTPIASVTSQRNAVAGRPGRTELIMAGVGGQGLALMGLLLAEAAGVGEGRFVAQTESHGVAVRGGPSRAEVIISDDEIDYPSVTRPDVVLALTDKDCQRYGTLLKEDGVLLYDATRPVSPPAVSGRVYGIPFVDLARKLGDPQVANVLALGALAQATCVVARESLEAAIRSRLPQEAWELNLRALDTGIKAASA